MPVYTLDPTSDSKNQWTTSPTSGQTAWSNVNKGTRQPTVPSSSRGIYDNSNVANAVDTAVTQPTYAANEQVTGITWWVYFSTIMTGTGTAASIVPNAGGGATTSIAAGSAAGWYSASYSGPPLSSPPTSYPVVSGANGLTSPGGANTILAIYAVITTGYVSSLSASLTPAGSMLKQAGKTFAASLTPAGGLLKQARKTFAASLTPAGGLLKATGRKLAASLTPAGGLLGIKGVKFIGYTDSGNTFGTANAVKPTGATSGDKLIAFTIDDAASGATITAPSGWTQIGATQNDASAGRTFAMFYSDSAAASAGPYAFTSNSGFAGFQVLLLAYRGLATGAPDQQHPQINAVSSSSSVNSGVTPTAGGETLLHFSWSAGSSASAGASGYTQRALNTIGRTYAQDRIGAPSGATGAVGSTLTSSDLSETWMLALAPAPTAAHAYTQALTAALTPAGTLLKATGRKLTAALTPAGTLLKATSRTLAATMTPSGALVKRTARILAASMTPSGAFTAVKLGFANFKTLTASLTPSGSLTPLKAAHAFTQALSASLTPAGTLLKATSRTLAASVTPAGALRRATSRTLTAALTPVGAVSRGLAKTLSGALSFVGNLVSSRVVVSTISARVTLTDGAVALEQLADAAVYSAGATDSATSQAAILDA